MKKSLIIAIGISSFLTIQASGVLAGDSGMDMSGSFAMRYEPHDLSVKMKGLLSYGAAGQLNLIDDNGQAFRIVNPSSAEKLFEAGTMRVALKAIAEPNHVIKVVEIQAL